MLYVTSLNFYDGCKKLIYIFLIYFSTSEELPKGDPNYARLTRINHNNDSFIVLITDGISGPLTAKEVVDTIHSKARI